MKRAFSFLIAAMGLIPSLSAQTPALLQSLPQIDEDFDQHVEECMDLWSIPGVAIGVVKNGQVVLAKGYGVKQIDQPDPVDENTLFQIASLTKAFTAALAGMLVDEGKLNWDDPVIKHLPEFQLYDPSMTREITVRDLLCHRSGLERVDNLWFLTPLSQRDVIHRIRALPPKWGIRSRFSYNNILYSTIGLLEENITGQRWETLLRERIFVPLGMQASLATPEELALSQNAAHAHTMYRNQVVPTPWYNYENCRPAISVCSTVTDLLKWVSLHMHKGELNQKPLLQRNTIEEMHRPQTVINDPEWHKFFPETSFLSYGLGWCVYSYKGKTIIEHMGSCNGFNTLIAFVPEENIGIVVLTNRDSWALFPSVIKNHLLDDYFGKSGIDWNSQLFTLYNRFLEEKHQKELEDERQRQAEKPPSLSLDQYAGTYENPLYGCIQIEWTGEELQMQSPIVSGRLEHWHFDTFLLLPPYEPFPIDEKFYLTFTLTPHGKVEGMKMTTPESASFVRLPKRENRTLEPIRPIHTHS